MVQNCKSTSFLGIQRKRIHLKCEVVLFIGEESWVFPNCSAGIHERKESPPTSLIFVSSVIVAVLDEVQFASRHLLTTPLVTIRYCGTEVVVITPYRALSNSLIYSFYCTMAGIELECSYDDFLKWLPTLRPYKMVNEIPWKEFVDQCYLV